LPFAHREEESITRKRLLQGEDKMVIKKILVPILLGYLLITCACKYILLPEGLEAQSSNGNGTSSWSAVVTKVEKTEAGDFRIDLTVRNGTGDWSAMSATAGEPAALTSAGKDMNCDKVYVSTGGHRLAPGFQMQAYITGTKKEPELQLIQVLCSAADASPGSTLSIPYTYGTGQYNYYEQDKNKVEDKLEINLDDVITDLAYPVYEEIEGLIQASDVEIVAINNVTLTLTDVKRTDTGLQFSWNAYNPGEYPTYVHIGNPPVIGEDGTLYGYYDTPDIISVPITPAGGNAEWTTEVAVPADVSGFYIILSVESGKARLFANYAIDITDQ
jgi:hypothetical protein